MITNATKLIVLTAAEQKIIFLVSFLPYIGWQVGSALSPNIGSLLVFRFLGGTFASSPLTVSGGLIADLWDADRRGKALSIFSLAPFAGPAIAPIVSGFMQQTNTNFRWIFWVLTIFAGGSSSQKLMTSGLTRSRQSASS